jgi:SOS response regulatory protein OraA/RecX
MTSDWAEPRQTSDERSRGGVGRRQGQRQERSYKPRSDASRKEQNSKAADGGYAKCMAAGVRLLAGREYSRLELANKLSRRFSAEAIDAMVAELVSLKVLDDERYGEAFCRSRVERGYGPGFIARELEQNGLGTELVEALLEPYQEQWFERALAQAQKAHRPKRRSFQNPSDPLDDAEFVQDDAFVEAGPSASRDDQWKERQKARGRLARLLARRGFSGALASKVIDQVLREAEAKAGSDSNFD